MLSYIFSRFPLFEVVIRRFFYSTLFESYRLKTKTKTKVSGGVKKDKKSFEEIALIIQSLDIVHGDVLIVHSSYEQLSKFDVSPLEIINLLKSLVGGTGTLVMPAFPVLSTKSAAVKGKHSEFFLYDKNSKICSTGLIPAMFLRTANVERSEFPYNTLAASGREARQMFEHNLTTDLAHGAGSSWHYCFEQEAKVLLLGVNPSKTLTIVHVAEDLMDLSWPIKEWFEPKDVMIKSNAKLIKFTARLRRQFWSRFMASEYRTKWFRDNKLLIDYSNADLKVSFVPNSKTLVEAVINNMKRKKNMFFLPPKKFWR
jgi:aminoglycoside 3-N-acetyltransferase